MKIALVGTAPATRDAAPYDDPSWSIWAVSPANMGHLPRWDEWFELHDLDLLRRGEGDAPLLDSEKIEAFLSTGHGKPIWVQQAYVGRYPDARAFPFAERIARYGDGFFTSSVAWMLAEAIERKPQAIGLWGVDMGASGEYKDQREGCHHFMALARFLGIEVVVPAESKLHARPRLYGYEPASRLETVLVKRLAMLRERRMEAVRTEAMLEGAAAVVEDILRADMGVDPS